MIAELVFILSVMRHTFKTCPSRTSILNFPVSFRLVAHFLPCQSYLGSSHVRQRQPLKLQAMVHTHVFQCACAENASSGIPISALVLYRPARFEAGVVVESSARETVYFPPIQFVSIVLSACC